MKNHSLLTLIAFALLWSCTSETLEEPVDCTTDGPQISLDAITDATCGNADGSAQLSAIGGEGNYTFSTEGFTDEDTGIIASLPAGNYTFLVTDGNGCTDEIAGTVGNKDGVNITQITTVDAGCNGTAGQITVEATSGQMPYMYKLDAQDYQSNNSFTGLTNRVYEVMVKDADGCEFSESTTVKSGISYQNSVAPIIAGNCSVTGCHNGTQFPDLRTYDVVAANAANIKSRTQNKSMPAGGGSLTQSQIDQIACWVNDGAPNN